jgi:glycosyltransferase involved in cell wall biosynthesis
MNSPKISVCIPLFNAEEYILSTLESVENQTYKNIEIIIVDDNSTDESCDVVLAFIKNSALSIIFERNDSNLGLAGNWNKAVSLASGKYIKILPCDDLIHKTCIEKQIAILERYESVSLVFCSRLVINFKGEEKLNINFLREGFYKQRTLLYLAVLLGTNPIGEPGAVMFRAGHAYKVGDFDDSLPYVIDIDYWLRLLDYGLAYKIPESLSFFRISNNLSVRLGRERYLNYQKFIDKIGLRYKLFRSILVLGKLQARVVDCFRKVVHWKLFDAA